MKQGSKMKFVSYRSFIISCFIGCLLLVILMPSCNAVDWDQGNLVVTPSHGPAGTQITVSVDIKNDVEPENWDNYYGIGYKIVWDVRPADIINPDLWGFENPIGDAYIDNDGLLFGTATIPSSETPGTYNIYAAYQRSADDPYHVYWWTTFTVEGGQAGSGTDTDGDGYMDDVDDFPYDPNEWFDSDGDGVGNNADPTPYGVGTDNNVDPNKKTPGFEIVFVVFAVIVFLFLKRNLLK